MRSADRAWLTLAAGIVAYDAFSPREELLSEGVDRYLEHHPHLTRTVVVYVAAHLLNLWPRRIDPLHQFAAWCGR